MMDVALPITAGMDCYEDMFKEITRKLYGEEGLPDNMGDGPDMHCHPEYDGDANGDGHGSALTAFGLAALMQNGFPPHPGMLRMDHMQEPKYRSALHGGQLPLPSSTAEDKWVSSEEILQWTGSRVASYNPSQKLFRCADCECVGFLSRVAEHWLGTHANLRVFQCPQCPYASAWARCVRMHLTRQHDISDPPGDSTALYKENPVLDEVTKYLQRLKAKVETRGSQVKSQAPAPAPVPPPPSTTRSSTATPSNSENSSKRYCCSYCPYATDRRDLFTRHENIHREEKPFQCYVCQKQFNRADHVKKHFLRMHRDYPYDLNRIRRQPPKNASGMSYYHKYNTTPPESGNSNQRTQDGGNHVHEGILTPGIHQGPHHLNIPGGFSTNLGPRMPSSVHNEQQKQNKTPLSGCNAKSHGGKLKRKGDKRYSCCYCSWSGVDNWCLKRHLNTHLKPFVCGLCDYKAARSERLATHVLKVHNKKACSRCSFLADDQVQLSVHLQEHQMCDSGMGCAMGAGAATGNQYHLMREHYEHNIFLHQRQCAPPLKSKQQYGGAARLFHYLEASDTSEPEEETQHLPRSFLEDEEDPPPFVCQDCGCEFVDDTSLETHNFTHHFPKLNNDQTITEKKETSNNFKIYQCSVCKIQLSSQGSIMEHMLTHSLLTERSSQVSALPLGQGASCARVSGDGAQCPHCDVVLQVDEHRHVHHAVGASCATCDSHLWKRLRVTSRPRLGGVGEGTGLSHSPSPSQTSRDGSGGYKRSRKQRQPRKVVSEMSDLEIQVLRRPGFFKPRRHVRKTQIPYVQLTTLVDKYTSMILSRKRLKCNWCRQDVATLPYHTTVSLALHNLWRHFKAKFKCEHCDKQYRHQYQIVLHSSREHVDIVPAKGSDQSSPCIASNSVPSAMISSVPESNKEPTNIAYSSEPTKSTPPFQSISCLNVPDASTLHANSQAGHEMPKMFSLLESYPKHKSSLQQLAPLHGAPPIHQQIPLMVPTVLLP